MSKNNHIDNSLQVRNYSSSLVREHESVFGDKPFMTVSFRYKDRWGSFIINPDDLEPSMRRDGEEIPNRINITLGDPDDVRMVSLTTSDGNGFTNQAMFNRTIMQSIQSSKHEFLKSIAI